MKVYVSSQAQCAHDRRDRAVQVVRAAAPQVRVAVRNAVASTDQVSERSIRRWDQREREGTLKPKNRGPKPRAVDRDTRQGVILLMLALGPCAGVAQIRSMFEEVPYRMITSMKKRLKRVRERRRGLYERRLKWMRAGTTWAMDFTKPTAKLPDGYKCLLVVRDLASGMRLTCVLCKGERTSEVLKCLRTLFAAYEPPLVMKHDGGPAFLAHKTQKLLESRGVASLRSPAYTPSYNGSVERSLGWMKKRIQHIAHREGHPGIWGAWDIEHARRQANGTLRPWGPRGPSPIEAFMQRDPITPIDREAFKRAVDEEAQRQLVAHARDPRKMDRPIAMDVLKRRSITHALQKLKYLTIRRGRISTPISPEQPDRNS